MLITGKVNQKVYLPSGNGTARQPELIPFADIIMPSLYNPYQNNVPLPNKNVNQPMLDADPMRSPSPFDPFRALSSDPGSPLVPQSKPLFTKNPLVFKKDPNPYVPEDEVIDLRDAASVGEAQGNDWLTWAIVLGGLGALYYYSKKKGKK
jgi:hypothetical protein